MVPSGQEDQNKEIKHPRPNENLLSLGKLRQSGRACESDGSGNNTTLDSSQGPELNSTLAEVQEVPPPPSYESVVKFNRDLESASLPCTSQLPNYQDVAGLKDAPPTYHSLFTDRVLKVINPFNDDDRENVLEMTTTVSTSKFGTFVLNFFLFIILVSFVLLLPIAMIVIGILFIHSCPVQPRIPIYLVVLGFFQMFECCGRLAYKLFQNNHRNNSWRERYRRKDPLVYFVIVWFVIGSMWVYQTDPECKDCGSLLEKGLNATLLNTTSTFLPPTAMKLSVAVKEKSLYCDKIIYNFAFWIITTYYSIIGFFCLMILVDVTLRAINRCCCPQR